MQTVTISYARTHLSRLVREVADGETFIVTKGGKPLVTFTAVPDEAIVSAHQDRDATQG
jgi:antitoxin (DNA-binding transcriptional repressor) of toxin-antitoxin stability system